MKKIIAILFLSIIVSSSGSFASEQQLPAPLFQTLGNFDYPIITTSKLAQRYFNQGMVLFYGFDYGESVRSFQGAIASDPKCSMCYIGLALAIGSKTNTPIIGNEIEQARTALIKASELNISNDKRTSAYINALNSRYAGIKQPKSQKDKEITSIFIPNNNARNFTDALWEMTRNFGEDQNVWALYAYSIFDFNRWDFWNNQLQPRASTLSMLHAIHESLNINPLNPGAIHYFIHMSEFSPYPEKALSYAIKLGNEYPGAEHLVHMASHLYFILGDYYKAVQQNLRAIAASDVYKHEVKLQGFEPITNYLEQHNYYFLLSDTMMAGLAKLSLQTGIKVEELTPIDSLTKNKYLERFYAEKFFAVAHFGLWDELKNFAKPDKKYTYLTAMWYYVHGLAYAHQADLKSANKMLYKLIKLKNTKTAKALAGTYRRNMNIATQILKANIATENKDFDTAVKAWQTAVNLQFKHGNGDPPPWYLANNQGLGFAHLRNNDPLAAKFAFDADLIIHPNNGWSLYGLAEVYKALDDEKNYRKTLKQFAKTWQHADTTLPIAQGSDIFASSTKF